MIKKKKKWDKKKQRCKPTKTCMKKQSKLLRKRAIKILKDKEKDNKKRRHKRRNRFHCKSKRNKLQKISVI